MNYTPALQSVNNGVQLIKWPLLDTNELTEGHFEVEEADNYEMRSRRVPADDSPAHANPFDKTCKELQEYLGTLQVSI